ncbi:cadmium resistance transporter [Mycolicibacterium porcinum]|uniref:cadmium resistance transporter n=1 Tax=Mycolicibacterium porcinum TaxID=39693 RepID=UPI0031F9A4B7
MDWALLCRAAGMFAVTNIDDVVVLALFFGQAGPSRSAAARVVIGQYLGFVAILAVSALGAFGATRLPPQAVPYLGFLPLALGLRAAWQLWRRRRADPDADQPATPPRAVVIQVATVTFANGGDNIGVYVPVFAVAGMTDMATYISVFLVGVALWCVAGWYFAGRPVVAGILSRWGHIILPVVLIAIGLAILIDGRAFGL